MPQQKNPNSSGSEEIGSKDPDKREGAMGKDAPSMKGQEKDREFPSGGNSKPGDNSTERGEERDRYGNHGRDANRPEFGKQTRQE